MNVTLLSSGSAGPAQSPTINLSPVSGQTLLIFVVGPVTLAVGGGSTTGWVRDFYKVNNIGFAIFRLPAADNSGGAISLQVTTNGPRNLAYIAIQGNVGSPVYGNFGRSVDGWTVENNILSGSTAIGTDIHTFAQARHTFAVFPLAGIHVNDVNLDITSYDQGYTELGDSGITPVDPNEESRVWLAYRANMSMVANGVNGTFNQPIVETTFGWCGMATYAVDYPITIRNSNGDELTPYLKTAGSAVLVRPQIEP